MNKHQLETSLRGVRLLTGHMREEGESLSAALAKGDFASAGEMVDPLVNEPFSSCCSGLTLAVLKNSDRLDEPSRLIGTTTQLPQELPDLELGERPLAAAA